MKGKPWSLEEEKQLQKLLAESKSVAVISNVLGKTQDSVRMKNCPFRVRSSCSR